jgi:hypothetical protein
MTMMKHCDSPACNCGGYHEVPEPPADTRTQHQTPDQTHGFPSHLESNPIILRARIAKANDLINEHIEGAADAEVELTYRHLYEALREIQTIIGGL